MPQISLYIDEKTLQKIKNAAARRNISISKLVSELIRSRTEPVYPKEYEELFGSIKDDTFEAPPEIPFSSDSHREVL
ncbi:MAG: DUF6364 family protein [Spirochaetaceae bacterium]